MNQALIEKLSVIPGVSGWEAPVREAILAEVGSLCTTHTDNLGNLICFKKGAKTPPKRLMLSAHMDEVGFIITYIHEDGLMSFDAVGGIDSRVVLGKAVVVGEGAHRGVIGTKALHMLSDEEKEKPPKLKDLFIDLGCTTRTQTEALVSIGDRAVFDSTFFSFGDGFIKGKALDDRAGCALLIDLIKEDLPYDCTFVFTTNEETGMAGAGPAAYGVGAEIGIAVESTTAGDIAGVDEDKYVCHIGGGPVISFMDKGTVYDHALYKAGMALAAKLGIPSQTKRGVFGGNEARAVQASAAGVRVMAVSIPTRYLHSPACVMQEQDVTNTYTLLRHLIAEVQEV